jgi:type I restriction enzyme S subunit
MKKVKKLNKLKELISKLCPNGVEHKKLGELIIIEKGKQLNKTLLSSNGKYPVINGGIMPSGYWNEYNYTENLITISQGGASAGYVNFIDTKFWAGAHCYVIVKVDSKINYRYVYHFLKSKENELKNSQVGAGIPSVSLKDINNLCIAVPSLEVQCEIVHILDDFTLLSAELSAELKARQKQYEFYRDKLLYFDEKIPRRKLIDVSSISRGKRVTKKDLNENNEFPVYQNSLAPMGYYKDYNYEKNKTYIISAGAAGEIGFCKENFWAADDCLVVYNLKEVLDKYVYYYLLVKQDYIKANVRKASIPRLSREIIKNIEIPIPSLERQEEIVNILDKFDKLCNDISEGLPAEIEARQKQYEYYRDKLLTFKELKVNE